MKNFKSSILNGFICFFALVLFCTAPGSEEKTTNWSSIIKELEIILASENADSAKAIRIKMLFDTNRVTLSDYREFYEKSIENKPMKNLSHLKAIEQLISEEMKTEARRQKKIGTEIDYRPGKKENLKK